MQTFDCPHCHRVFEMDPGSDEVVYCPHCNSAVAVQENDLEPGTRIGGFEIIRLLGRGGMGNVYLANQLSMSRPVALKILLSSMTQDKESVNQFLNEVRVSGRLNHRNIITAIDAGEIDGTYYLVTSYVDGCDIEHRLEEEKIIPEKEALRIILKIADALKYAWENHGILHKDIKPGNLMLDSKGEVFLMDMGIAQFIGEAPKEDEHILGSPFFMSPEQVRGEQLTWSSDLYSLGATLYNMVVAVPPYDADDVMKIIEMHSTAPFPQPSERNPKVKISKSTVALLKKMMGKKPEDRFDSWASVKSGIEKALKALTAPPPKKEKKKKPTNKKTRGKKKSLSTSPSRHRAAYPVKKSGGGAGIFFLILFVALLGGAAYFFLDKQKNDTAKAFMNRAESYYKMNPSKYNTILNLFTEAADKAAGTQYGDEAESRLAEVEKELKRQVQLVKKYKAGKSEIGQLIKKKRYRKAIKLIRGQVRDIKDPVIKNEAEIYIQQLKAMQRKNLNR